MRVDTHDFPDRELGRAVPSGIYDVVADTGWVNVGTDHDTAAAGGTAPGGPPIGSSLNPDVEVDAVSGGDRVD